MGCVDGLLSEWTHNSIDEGSASNRHFPEHMPSICDQASKGREGWDADCMLLSFQGRCLFLYRKQTHKHTYVFKLPNNQAGWLWSWIATLLACKLPVTHFHSPKCITVNFSLVGTDCQTSPFSSLLGCYAIWIRSPHVLICIQRQLSFLVPVALSTTVHVSDRLWCRACFSADAVIVSREAAV